MKLTPEQLRQAADAMDAHAAGKVVEYRHNNENIWYAAKPRETLAWDLDMCAYRPKPEPVVRPWTPEEMRGKWIKWRSGSVAQITQIDDRGRAYIMGQWMEAETMLNVCTQLDGTPCGVTT